MSTTASGKFRIRIGPGRQSEEDSSPESASGHLCNFGELVKWSLHLCEMEKCPPHSISARISYEIHIITRFCSPGGPLLHRAPGSACPAAPAPTPGGCRRDGERQSWGAGSAQSPPPSSLKTEPRPQATAQAGTEASDAGQGGQRSTPSPHFGGQPPSLTGSFPPPPLKHGGRGGGKGRGRGHDPFMPGIGSRCSRGVCSCILAFFGKKRVAASGTPAASANPREEGEGG